MFTVGPGNVMRGRIVAAGAIKLDGWLEGEIVCSRLDIGPDGYLLGSVIAREIFVEGQIVGSVTAGAVHLLAGAFVEGDVRHAKISVMPGGTLSGRSFRIAGLRMPDEFLSLEARSVAEHADLDRVERESLKATADRAVVEYPRYQRARERLAARRQA
jgi:hypothetical protein